MTDTTANRRVGTVIVAALIAGSIAGGAAPALARPEVRASEGPMPADTRCGEFGWDPKIQATVPVAWPLIMDLSARGALAVESANLADAIAMQLRMTGSFSVLPRDAAPSGGAITWISPLAFDYLGWREAGAWMVITGELDLEDDGLARLTMSAYLTEEGDVLQMTGTSASMPVADLVTFGRRFVDSITACVTGCPGMLFTRIVYARKAPGTTKEIWMTDVGSGLQVQISSDGSLAVLPAWGPGGAVAWTGYSAGNPDLYLDKKLFGSRPGLTTGVSFAPDGTVAALAWGHEASTDIYLVDPISGRTGKRLTSGSGDNMSPSWSPDSKKIAFVSDRKGFPTIFTMDRDGASQRALPIAGNYNTGPDWSPDGTRIAWQGRGEGGRFSIWVLDLATGQARRVSRGGFNDEEPSWSADGRFIVYTSTRNGRKRLYVMKADGSDATPVFNDDAEYFTPAWERRIPSIKSR